MFHIIGHIIFGLIVGIIAKFIMPGSYHLNLIYTIVLGMLGAWLGGLIGRLLHLYPPGHPAGFFMALIGAMLLLFIYGYMSRNSTTTTTLLHAPQYAAQLCAHVLSRGISGTA